MVPVGTAAKASWCPAISRCWSCRRTARSSIRSSGFGTICAVTGSPTRCFPAWRTSSRPARWPGTGLPTTSAWSARSARSPGLRLHPLCRAACYRTVVCDRKYTQVRKYPEIRIRRPCIVGYDEFSDPEVGSAEYPPHCEALAARLSKARRLNVAPAADALARLRVLEHRILSVNLVLRLEVVGVGGGPVAIQGRSDVVVFHLDLPSHWLCIFAHMALVASPTVKSQARPRTGRECPAK